jgi:3-hydroxyacyl-CoA dehydrogenase
LPKTSVGKLDKKVLRERSPAPEREALKIKLFADIDSILPPPAILASSTSGIPMSRIQSECKHPERCVTGHPFNPPHLIPLVEVVGGAKTSAETIERVMRLYTAMGKRAMHIRKEVMGHVANRLQAALYREVAYLIDQDVVSVADADAAVCMGPGLRWALMGPNLIYHLGGGRGGMHHFLKSYDGVLGRSRLSRPCESRTAEKDCGRRAGGGRWPLIRRAIARAGHVDYGTTGIALASR